MASSELLQISYGFAQSNYPMNTGQPDKSLFVQLIALLCTIALCAKSVTATQGVTTLLITGLSIVLCVSHLFIMHALIKKNQKISTLQRLGRRLVSIRKDQRRNEAYALKILRHINSISGQTPAHASIWQKPLHKFSGDLAMACESKDGNKYTLLADLTGHGIAAALGAVPVAAIFRATATQGLQVECIVEELNNRLHQLLPAGFFCCATVIRSDQSGTTICNAGLPDIIVANQNGLIVDQLGSEQLPLGIQPVKADEVSVFRRQYNDSHQLYAYTDGIIETVSTNDEVFDTDTLISLISSKNTDHGRILKITENFEAVTKGSSATDDISIVEVIIR